jgi:hypothetical protein
MPVQLCEMARSTLVEICLRTQALSMYSTGVGWVGWGFSFLCLIFAYFRHALSVKHLLFCSLFKRLITRNSLSAQINQWYRFHGQISIHRYRDKVNQNLANSECRLRLTVGLFLLSSSYFFANKKYKPFAIQVNQSESALLNSGSINCTS